jgi:hypothetical protein
MEIGQAAEMYGTIPRKALTRLVEDGLITLPLAESDQHALTLLNRIWATEWYVAQMNKCFKPDKRAVMLAFPELGKIDRYVLNSYLNLEPKVRVSIREMVGRVRKHFHAEYPDQKIKRLRQMAYNLKRDSRGKSRKRTMIQLALLREVPSDEE